MVLAETAHVVAQYWSATGRPASDPQVAHSNGGQPAPATRARNGSGGRHARRVVPGRAGRHERRR
jgi:hypothetical protein